MTKNWTRKTAMIKTLYENDIFLVIDCDGSIVVIDRRYLDD